GFARKERLRDVGHLGTNRGLDEMERRLRIVDRFGAGDQLIWSIHIWAVKAIIAEIVALIKDDIEKRRKCRAGVGVKPDLHRAQVWRAVVALDLFWGAERNVCAAAVRAPAFLAGADAKMRVGVGDSLVNVVLVGVYVRAGHWIAYGPEMFDELVAGVVGGEIEEILALLLRNNVGDIMI